MKISVITAVLTFMSFTPSSRADNSTMKTETATLGGGCFWCIEAVYEDRPGVLSAVSGYAGGTADNPDYESVCTGKTGHAEVVQITFDPDKISYSQILEIFWKAHDPTSLNRQGADIGTQYRSIILTANSDQEHAARESKARAQKDFQTPIVTEIVPLKKFYPAEGHHQNFQRENPGHPYCRAVIAPKLKKLEGFVP